MIYLYPANKMEHLLQLYAKVQQVNPLPIFHQEAIVVQNAGMQHWLSMELAKARKISFNFSYALPAQFLWKLARTVAGEENVPDETLFSREVLSWRILSLLMSDEIIADQDFAQVTQFWQGQQNDAMNQQRCYQLACQLADLYEQYLIYRPQWITSWNDGNFIVDDAQTDSTQALSKWQGKLWQQLTKDIQYDPHAFIKLAINNIALKVDKLPKRVSFFGINALAPLWLDFINALSEHIEIHFFHLNPCADYWGDIQSEKQVFKQMDTWLSQDEISELVTNPLLANLGQQGKEFLSLLQQYSTINIDAFEHIIDVDNRTKLSSLASVQHDILTLTDAREHRQKHIDNSITITKAHSAMREIQGLHDWLLHQFNQDKSLTPKDVLVMCPEVENYAPYVNAVFTKGWQELADDVPPLPCSIADRVSKNAEPIVAAFIELLHLPDSRFHISQILALLRVEQVKNKFSLADDDIDKMSQWLQIANVHWGLDSAHKKHVLSLDNANNSFTWQKALQSLLRGFAYQDQDQIFADQMLLSQVEGNDAQLLGQLILIIDMLQQHSILLSQAKTADNWQQYLLNFIDDFFLDQESQKLLILKDSVNLLAQYCLESHFDERLSLQVVQSFLNNHFSVPDPGRQFMIGQVTFCSMVPMRSIPFKIIAVLGLNDGEFPRQRQPLSYDLISQLKPKLGDRSRRGDDRYLFLEAIISARQALYLSYQGNSLKNNAEKQPSIVLKELMDYLAHGYEWQLLDNKSQLRTLAMQPFAKSNYQGDFASFDANWLKLALNTQQQKQHNEVEENALSLAIEVDTINVELAELVRFFEHPSKYFARQQLNLYLDKKQLLPEDVEPFAVSRLDAYQYRDSLLTHYLESDTQAGNLNEVADQLYQAQCLRGQLPDLPSTAVEVEHWRNDVDDFYQALAEFGVQQAKRVDVLYQYHLNVQEKVVKINLSGTALVLDEHAIVYRVSEPKAKDMLTMVLSQLLLQCGQVSIDGKIMDPSIKQTTGLYFNTKSQKVEQYELSAMAEPEQHLTALLALYLQGQQQPLLVNLPLAEKIQKSKGFDQQVLEDFWCDSNLFKPFSEDEYMQYFWQQTPNIDDLPDQLTTTLVDLLAQVKKQRKGRR